MKWTSVFAAENLEACRVFAEDPKFIITRLSGTNPDSLLRGDLVQLLDKTDGTLTKGYFVGRLQGYDGKIRSIIILGQNDLTIHFVPGDNVSLKIESGLVPTLVDPLLDIDEQWNLDCLGNSIVNCIYTLKAMNSTQKIVALAAPELKARRDLLFRLTKRLESSGSEEQARKHQKRALERWTNEKGLVYETIPNVDADAVKKITDALRNRNLVLLGYHGLTHSRQESVFNHQNGRLEGRLLDGFLLPAYTRKGDAHAVLLLGIIHTDRFGDRVLVLDSALGTFLFWRIEDLKGLIDGANAYIVSTGVP